MKKAILFIAILLLLVGTVFAIAESNNSKIETRNVKIELDKNKSEQIKLEEDYKKLEGANTGNEQKVQELELKRQQLEEEKKNLEAQLQAKAELKASQSKVYAAVAPTVPFTARTITGDKQTWLRASGIPESDWGYVDSIVSRESGWNPCAYNPGRSDCNANPTSACGLAQSLPCGKQSVYGHWTDPVANLKWQYDYVKNRYGGYAQAVAFWNANHWY